MHLIDSVMHADGNVDDGDDDDVDCDYDAVGVDDVADFDHVGCVEHWLQSDCEDYVNDVVVDFDEDEMVMSSQLYSSMLVAVAKKMNVMEKKYCCYYYC